MDDPLGFLPKECLEGSSDPNCYLMDLLIGFIYHFPIVKKEKPAPAGAFEGDPKPKPFKPDGQFYKFALDLFTKSFDDKEDFDLYYKKVAYVAMSLSSYIEQKRLKQSVQDVPFNEIPAKDAAWKKVFKFCDGKCNMFTFRLRSDTATPIMNDYFYRRNSSLAFTPSYNR